MNNTWSAVSALDRMVDDVMGSMLGTAETPRAFTPAVDVRANDNEVIFVCDVPGVKEADLEVTIENRVLTIKGARKFEGSENEQIVLGRTYGNFERAFRLPEGLDDEHIAAKLSDGVLEVRIPKLPVAKPRRIEVFGGSKSKQLK